MRARILLLTLPMLGLGCGPDEGSGLTTGPTTPMSGPYQATLQGYTENNCDQALSEPTGVLDASAEFGFPMGGTIALSGSRMWHYGPVVLAPGDPNDVVARASWVGESQPATQVGDCPLQAGVYFQYFPADATHGTLRSFQRYVGAADNCSLKLTCQLRATWLLVRAR